MFVLSFLFFPKFTWVVSEDQQLSNEKKCILKNASSYILNKLSLSLKQATRLSSFLLHFEPGHLINSHKVVSELEWKGGVLRHGPDIDTGVRRGRAGRVAGRACRPQHLTGDGGQGQSWSWS